MLDGDSALQLFARNALSRMDFGAADFAVTSFLAGSLRLELGAVFGGGFWVVVGAVGAEGVLVVVGLIIDWVDVVTKMLSVEVEATSAGADEAELVVELTHSPR